jgi:hypothetical protein
MPRSADPPRDEVTPLPDASLGLYARLLGSSWWQFAEPVRLAHAAQSTLRGRFRITHGRGHVARVLAALLRLPRPSRAAETRLVIAACGNRQQWRRTFDDRHLDTWQYQTGDGELGERIGVLEFRFRLNASNGSLVFRQVEAAFVLGSVRLRLPAAWAPRIEAREDPAGADRIVVSVRVVLPGMGLLLTYDGTSNLEDHHG